MIERIEKMRVSDEALDLVFRKARTYNAWLPKPVPEELLGQLYDTLKWGPTSANISPARFVFIRSTAAKERLRPSLAPGNVEKTMAAPVTVIIAYDLKFYDKLPRLFPHYPAMRNMFVNTPQLIQETALRNSTLQGAYMILAARALGHDADGVMETEFYLPNTFATQESAIEPAIQAGRQKLDVGFERGSVVVNG
jgi:3-hydroxypropanoate dehydrogenase